MGSTTRRRGVYGGEYAPTGLRLFAWWKKNGEKRLQKPGSGSAGIISHSRRSQGSFYRRRDLTNGLGQTSPQSARQVKKKRSYRMRICLVHVTVRNRSDRSMHVRIWRCGLAAHASPTGDSKPASRQGPARAGHHARASQAPWSPRSAIERARRPGRRRCPLFFLSLFLPNK
jgi:hypothetical protein